MFQNIEKIKIKNTEKLNNTNEIRGKGRAVRQKKPNSFVWEYAQRDKPSNPNEYVFLLRRKKNKKIDVIILENIIEYAG